MKEIPLSHFFPWKKINDDFVTNILCEFADNGAESVVLTDEWGKRLVKEPGFYTTLLGWLRESGMKIFECHGLWSIAYDLNITDRPRRRAMIEEHKLCMEYAADLGCRTYVMHIGAFDCYYKDTTLEEMRRLAVESLEKLIPAAEKLGIIIAIENSFEPSNTPDEVLYFLNYFNTPVLGCCFDTGHANIMAKTPGKDSAKYASYMNVCWKNGVVEEADAFGKLAPHIVTCHLHDNDGYGDAHNLPGTGTIDWKMLIPALKNCPRIVSMQNETSAGAYHVSIAKLCRTFDELMKL
ncbi:MAG: sugar phosphate isomerase/epimerase family protein [Victivallales bacterium]